MVEIVLFGENSRVEGDGVRGRGSANGSGEVEPGRCVLLGLMESGSEGWREFEFEMRFCGRQWKVGVLGFWNCCGGVGWVHGQGDRDGMVKGLSYDDMDEICVADRSLIFYMVHLTAQQKIDQNSGDEDPSHHCHQAGHLRNPI